MNNLLIKKEEGRLYASLNNNYNTTNVINIELTNATKKIEKSKVKGKTTTSSRKVNIRLQLEKQIDVISRNMQNYDPCTESLKIEKKAKYSNFDRFKKLK